MEVWNGVWKIFLVSNGIWIGRFSIWEWKKILSMECGKIFFHKNSLRVYY